MKRYLNTPEEVIDALKAGKIIRDKDSQWTLRDGVIMRKDNNMVSWAVNDCIYSTYTDIYVDEPELLKLEVGKFYKTRDGRKAWVMECTDMKGAFPFRVATQRECSTYVITKDGRRYFEDTDGTDLVAPWEE